MKTALLLFALACVAANTSSFAQEWRDSLNYARELYKSGSYKEALKYYKSAERLAPNDVDLSEEKGQSAYRAGNYQEAEQAFQSAAGRVKGEKRKSSAYNNLGNSRMKQQDYAGAEEAFKEALRRNPENEKARQSLAEAKRLKKKQEEEQKKQQQKNQQEEQNKGNNNPQSSSGDQQKQSDSNGQKKQPSDAQKESNGQTSGNSEKQQTQQSNSGQKLSDKQTERKLDELMRQEMDAKKRLDGAKGKTNGSKAKKDW